MALFTVELQEEWETGKFTQALVVAPNALAALKAVEHLTGPDGAKRYKVTRESTSGTRLLWTEWGE